MKTLRSTHFLLPLLLIFVTTEGLYFQGPSSGVFGKIKAGVEMAGKFLGLDRAEEIAQMVSETFKGTRRVKTEDQLKDPNIFSGFLRLLGLSSKKLSAIAVNAIIFVAQLISTSFSKPPPSELTEARTIKAGDPLDWVMDNSKVVELMEDVKDENLTKSVVESIKERTLDEETDCIQLFVCKSTPLVRGMQKSLGAGKNIRKGKEAFFEFLPSKESFEIYGDNCEKKHPYCLIY